MDILENWEKMIQDVHDLPYPQYGIKLREKMINDIERQIKYQTEDSYKSKFNLVFDKEL